MNKRLPISLEGMRIGLYPFGVQGNPYQQMIADALTDAGFTPRPLPKHNWFALRWAVSQPIDILQMYWPHSLYHGATPLKSWLKRRMFFDGLSALARLPFMYSVDNLFPHDAKDGVFERKMVQHLVDRADGFLVMSEASGQIFRQNYRLPEGTECYHVPHCNYLGVYPNAITRRLAREKLKLPPNAKVVLFFGRLLWYKGLDQLVPAFLKLDAPDAVLLLAGQPRDPALVPTLEEKIAAGRHPQSGQVRIDARFIPDNEVQLYMNAADVVALPYADMPMSPGALILAMSFGKPVVAPTKGAIPEIAGSRALFGYDENTAGSLSAALECALGASDLVQRGNEAIERARTNHSRERVAAAFRQAYGRLAKKLNLRKAG